MKQLLRNLLNTVKSHFLRALFSLTIVLFFAAHVAEFQTWSFISSLENLSYDARMNLTMPPQTQDKRIVIVDIDERSLKELGRWPWSRDKLARIVDRLFDDYQINILGFDAVFPEPDNSSGLQSLKQLAANELKQEQSFIQTINALETKLNYDEQFAKSLEGRRVVLGYFFAGKEEVTLEEATAVGELPQPSFTSADLGGLYLPVISGVGYASNQKIFADNARSGGFFNSTPDSDGITRRVPMMYEYKGAYYEALSLAMMRIYMGIESLDIDIVQTSSGYLSMEHLALGNRVIPLGPNIQAFIPFHGPRNSYPYISAADVFNGKADKALLKDAIVLLGTTAQGLFDLRATPVDEVYPGVEIHANIIAGILDNSFLSQPAYLKGAELMSVILVGLLMTIILLWLNPFLMTLSSFFLGAGLLTLNLYLWVEHQTVMPIAATLLMMIFLFIFNMSYGYFVESRGKRELTGLFGQYVPAELVDEMSKNPNAKFSMEGESREMTVLFSDVRGFTSLSEGLEPKELSELMNTFLTPMTRVIHENRGTIDKYMGDAIMAFWGAPLADEKHARHALQAALQMQQTLQELNPQLVERGWPAIRIGVGINTGMMSVGNMGSEFRMAYTVLGDAVNLGSRLEGLTKQYGVQIIVSETTKEAVPDYLYRELDKVRVKGKDQPVSIFEPLGSETEVGLFEREALQRYHHALELYRQQYWQAAQTEFSALMNASSEHYVYQMYLERIAHFREHPPGSSWDGVFTHTTK